MSEGIQKKQEKRPKFQAIKGTRDLLPPDTELWNRVEATAREVFGTFGFGEIRPPIFEPYKLFSRSIGDDTDIVNKEMYAFPDRAVEELERLREDIHFISVSSGDRATADEFIKLTKRFSSRLQELRSLEEIPNDSFNKRAIDFFVGFAKDAERILSSEIETKFGQEMFDSKVHGIKGTVDAIRLGQTLALRPEATASVCRAYIEHGMHAWPQPVKLYYMGPMFRRERPQKGRYRQFYQIGAEVLETVQPGQGGAKDIPKDAAVDAEVIEMVMTFFARLGLEGTQLEINSIGHAAENCRRGYVQKLKAALVEVQGQLGDDSRRRIETNPLRVLDSKLESEQAIIAGLPKIAEHLCNDCAKQYAEVKRQLNLRGVKYAENWRLVRGLDYYMRTTFEITAKGLGSQNAVCGGGRYDGLVELLGGLPTKGIGFAIGEDRLVLSLQESGKAQVFRGRDVYIAWMGEKACAAAIRAAKTLRSAGLSVELPPVEQKFGKALGQADKLGAKYTLIFGDKEISEGLWTLKIMSEGSQVSLDESAVLDILLRDKTNSR